MKKITFALIYVLLVFLPSTAVSLAAEPNSITCWFPPGWIAKEQEAQAITDALSEKSGLRIKARVAEKYSLILAAFDSPEQVMTYVGSFVQVVINFRNMGTALVQVINGEEFYSGIMIYPAGQAPLEILKNNPEQVAYTVAASSGESCAKAATFGRAAIEMPFHLQAAAAVKTGKAKAAFVKNWWWQKNKHAFPGLLSYELPRISEQKNPDYILTVSKSVPDNISKRIKQAALDNPEIFGGSNVVPFDPGSLIFSFELMNKGRIDPLTYKFK